MPIENRERQIGAHLFAVTQFGATQGLKLFTRLTKMIGPAAAGLAKAKEAGSILDVDVSILGDVVACLAERLDEDDVLKTVKELLTQTQIDGRQPNFEMDFGGRYGLLFKALAFVLEVNYGDFLAVLPVLPKAGKSEPQA